VQNAKLKDMGTSSTGEYRRKVAHHSKIQPTNINPVQARAHVFWAFCTSHFNFFNCF